MSNPHFCVPCEKRPIYRHHLSSGSIFNCPDVDINPDLNNERGHAEGSRCDKYPNSTVYYTTSYQANQSAFGPTVSALDAHYQMTASPAQQAIARADGTAPRFVPTMTTNMVGAGNENPFP